MEETCRTDCRASGKSHVVGGQTQGRYQRETRKHGNQARPLWPGRFSGPGTISHVARSKGSACLAGVRMLETIADGGPKTDFMKLGDRIRIEMCDPEGNSIFGAIDQKVRRG